MDSDINPEAVAEIKFCINCQHIATVGSGDADRYKCMAPQNPFHRDFVTGFKIYTEPNCRPLRECFPDTLDKCTSAGNWYVKKVVPAPAPPLWPPTTTGAPSSKVAELRAKALKDTKKLSGNNLADALGL